MINYILLHKKHGVVNVAGVFANREEAEDKKRQREEEEKNWKLWERHEYYIEERAE